MRGAGSESPLQRAVLLGAGHLVSRQQPDGAWRGEYGGPGFLLPLAVSAYHIAGQPLPAGTRDGILSTLRGVVGSDGGVGLHPEASGCMFTSALTYAGLRLLGVSAQDPDARRLRGWIHANGTPLASASWGKYFLALLNLYPYEGLTPVLPELWLLPRAAPVHPGRLWCHSRQVYLPLAYLYGLKAAMPEDDLVRELRQELYQDPYAEIPFRRHLHTVHASDNLYPLSWPARAAGRLQHLYERVHGAGFRRKALAEIMDHIRVEDRSTGYLRIGPVNAVLNTLVHHFAGNRQELQRSFEGLAEYLVPGHSGVLMNGYSSTALWDTAFAVRALLAAPQAAGRHDALRAAHAFVRENQVTEDIRQGDRYFRHPCRGGWPFSDLRHGWPITDCTAEGLIAALSLGSLADRPVPDELLVAAVRLLLGYQNDDGGWATYELRRGGKWLELLNPSQAFGNIMVDHSHVECTGSVLSALARARRRFPALETARVARALERGQAFLRARQQAEGGWPGAWGVCFTYGTWFAVRGLMAAGVRRDDSAIRRAVRFLLGCQRPDGAWGEHPDSCLTLRYTPHAEGQAVNTAWAMLTLVQAGVGRGEPVARAARWLVQRQLPTGEWPRESLKGVFNHTTLIDYDNYRRTFPTWALAAFLEAGGQLP